MVRLFKRPRQGGAGYPRLRSAQAVGANSTRRARLAVDRLEDRLTPSGETVMATIGTLPSGRSVTVTFDATVDNPLTKGIDTVFNQGSVSGTNFATVRTDDPALLGGIDPTATTVDRAPMVAGVFVRGSAWGPAFLTGLQTLGVGNATFGFAVPTGANQTLPLPWENIDRVSVRFTENVVVGAGDLTVFGSAVPNYALTAAQFSYDAVTFTATWAFASPVGADRLRLQVASGPAAVRSAADGKALDGEWIDGTATFNSGDGQPGTDFSFQFNVLPGDVNRSNAVNVTDLTQVNTFISTGAGSPSYLVDVNSSGAVNVTDLVRVNQKIVAGATTLPAGAPGGTPGSGWVAPTTPTPPSPPGVAGTTVTATNVDSLLTDVDADGQADPGDTIRYTIVITNVSLSPNATGVTLTDTLDPRMTLVAGSVHFSPLAFADAYTWVSNTQLDSAARGLPSLFANDTIANVAGGTDTIVLSGPTTIATTLGGSVTINATTGAYVYTPEAGDTGNDTFTYTIANSGNPAVTSSATVTIGLGTQRVWYVQGGPTNGDGRSHNPFNSPASASAAATGTDIIYVLSSGTAVNGPFTLENNQHLLGQGVSLTVNTVTPFTGSLAGRPTLTNTTGNVITLGTGNTIQGLTLGDTSGINVTGGTVGTFTMNSVSKTGTGRAIGIATSGTLNVTFDSLTSTSSSVGPVVNLQDVTGTFVVTNGAGTDTSIASAAAGIRISGATAGAVFNFGDTSIGSSGAGVSLTSNNVAATTSFASLAITTSAGVGLAASSGGILTINGTSSSISATGGAAIDVATLAFGGGGATFATVSSSNSPTQGINLNAVTGNLTANGGTITGSTGTAFARSGGSAADTYNGTITVTNGQTGVSVSNPTGGSLTLGTVNVSNTGAANSIDAVVIDGNAAAAFDLTIASATLNATNMRHGLVLGELVSGSDITITGGTITAAATGDRVVNFAAALNANVNLSGVTLTGTNSDGLDFTNTVQGTYQFGAYTANTPNGGIALEVAAGVATVTFASLTQSGGTTGVSITGATTGAVAINGGAISGTSGTDFSITGVAGATGNVTYAGTINNSAGNSVVVTAKPGGTVTFSGAITDTAGSTGISLTTNTGATVSFTGGLSLTTTTNVAFTATGGGTVNVTGASNAITTTTATALNLNGVTIGASGMTFATINTSGAAQGVVLNTVGQAAGSTGLTVGGGTIANATTNGVFLDTVTANVSIAASISSTAAGRTVNVEDSGSTAAGGNQITFSGAIDENGLGIRLNNNDANNDATVTFSGSLDIDTAAAATAGFDVQEGGNVSVTGPMDVNTTVGNDVGITLVNNGTNTIAFNSGGTGLDITSGSGTGFNATGSGVITVQGSGNSITTTTGTALNLNGVTIGASGITFATINTSGAAQGIVLNTVGQAAGSTGLTVGGGTIANASTNGVFLDTVTANVAIAAGISSAAGGRTVNVEDSGSTAAGGNQITFSGAIDENGLGIRLFNNDANNDATITFSNSLDIDPAANSTGFLSQDGGNVSVTGQMDVAATGTGLGVSLVNNTGNTLSFNSSGTGLDITSVSGTGFNATGGGTVTVQGTSNTINSTSATALNVASTTIGGSGLTFVSISSGNNTAAADPANGIVLNNTGSSGGLTVTGTGNTSVGGNDSGGVIQNTTNYGISLTSTLSPSFTNMNVHDIARNGIDGFGVTNFTFANGKITTTGTASVAGDFEVSAIAFVDRSGANDNTINGTVSITGSTISDPERNGIMIETWAGTISNLNISNNTLDGDGAGTTNSRIQDAVHVFAQGTTGGITTGAISNNTISDFRFFDTAPVIDIFIGGNGIRLVTDTNSVNPASTLGTIANPIVISNNDIDNVGSNMIAVTAVGRTASANVRILDNGTLADPMTNAEGLGISVFFGGNGTFNGLVHNNVIDNIDQGANPSGSSGIGVQSDFGGNAGANTDITNSNFTISNNTISDMAGNGIIATGINNAGTMRVRIIDNDVLTIPDLTARFGIRVGHSNVGTQPAINLEIHGNDTAGGNPVFGPPDGIGIRQQTGFTFGIEGLTPSPATGAQAATYINGQNTGETTTVISGNNFTNVNVPDSPTPMFAADGGVEAAKPLSPAEPLTVSQLAPILPEAVRRWEASGLTPAQAAALQAVTFQIMDLGGDYLGLAPLGGTTVTLDDDASGYGWYVDPTPADDSEFTRAASGTRWSTDPTLAPAGRMDLLTTVMHELGHILGLEDEYAHDDRDNLMYGYLTTGERRLPGLVPTDRADKPEPVGRGKDSSPAAGKRADAPPPASVSSVATDWWGVALTPRRNKTPWSFAPNLDPIALD